MGNGSATISSRNSARAPHAGTRTIRAERRPATSFGRLTARPARTGDVKSGSQPLRYCETDVERTWRWCEPSMRQLAEAISRGERLPPPGDRVPQPMSTLRRPVSIAASRLSRNTTRSCSGSSSASGLRSTNHRRRRSRHRHDHAVRRAEGRATEIEVRLAEVWTVRDRLLVERRSYSTKAQALEAAGLSE